MAPLSIVRGNYAALDYATRSCIQSQRICRVLLLSNPNCLGILMVNAADAVDVEAFWLCRWCHLVISFKVPWN